MVLGLSSAAPRRPEIGNVTNDRCFYPEVQSLRGIAVLLVLIYHVFPHYLPGGYVGVDVFFIISGYLITGHLVREYEETGTVSISNFYIRRIKRLVPAATLVLLCALSLLPFFLPRIQWAGSVYEVVASLLYLENWALYYKRLDYLAADYPPTPVQHYWSLSIEEQFYIIWPLLFYVGISSWSCLKKVSVLHLMVPLVCASFVYSLILSQDNRTGAYFNTLSRLWELGVGGIFAILKPTISINTTTSLVASFVGLVIIITSAILFDGGTTFPGPMALIPVLGAILFLFALGEFGKFLPLRLLLNKPLIYIGNISYSLYLWHWVIVAFAIASGVNIDFCVGIILIAISFIFSHLTKIYVEDRYREKQLIPEVKPAIKMVAGAIILISIPSLSISVYEQYLLKKDRQHYYSSSKADFPGALAFEPDFEFSADTGVFIPSPAMARDDISSVYKDGCHSNESSVEPVYCTYGNSESKVTIALVGDSHAAQWVPAMEIVALNQELRLLTFTKSSCPFVGETIYLRERPYDECDLWYDNVLNKLREIGPNVVITTHYVGHLAMGARDRQNSVDILSSGLERTWQSLMDKDIKIIAIKDTPKVGIDIPDCVAKEKSDLSSCSVPREKAFGLPDSIPIAARRLKKVSLIDLTDKICGVKICRPIVGNVLVYRDGNHLTSTYVKSLSYEFSKQLDSAGLF